VSDADFKDWVDAVSKVVDAVGVAIVVLGLVVASAIFVARALRSEPFDPVFRSYRQNLGRAILLGLEFLVAGDIIRTVAVNPSFQTAGVLALIVLIRTFLSMALQVEIEGRWPWASRQPNSPAQPGGAETRRAGSS
jgi:uncharacterized membrane protein